MSQRQSTRLKLLEAYEGFARKETVNIRAGNFEVVQEMQAKKAKVIEKLAALPAEAVSEEEKKEFNRRLQALQTQEDENATVLSQKMEANRKEYKKLTQNSVAASKLRKAYVGEARSPQRGDNAFDGRA